MLTVTGHWVHDGEQRDASKETAPLTRPNTTHWTPRNPKQQSPFSDSRPPMTAGEVLIGDQVNNVCAPMPRSNGHHPVPCMRVGSSGYCHSKFPLGNGRQAEIKSGFPGLWPADIGKLGRMGLNIFTWILLHDAVVSSFIPLRSNSRMIMAFTFPCWWRATIIGASKCVFLSAIN